MRKGLPHASEQGNVLLCVICTIGIVSVIGGNVLLNCTTRFNASSSQVRAWKESLCAAEAGGDIAYAEIRKTISNPTQAFSGWNYTAGVWSKGDPAKGETPITFGANTLQTISKADVFYVDGNGNSWYRIRSQGIAPVRGFKRVTMDDRMAVGVRGDSLLRKIDFNYDHFAATYGPNGDNQSKAVVPVNNPQLSRRVELVASPVTPFEAAVKALSAFSGPGSAGWIDSYNSKNGAYYFAANSPSDPHYSDARSGGVMVNSANFDMNQGPIYGGVTTNGGNVKPSNLIKGNIDNNVPFTLPPFSLPSNLPLPQTSPTTVSSTTTIIPPTPGTASNPTYYVLSALTGTLTIAKSGSAQTYVAIRVRSDITGKITVNDGVHAVVYFEGDISVKARDIDNPSNLAANLQFYGVSPTDGSTQSIDIASPGNFAAAIYAPSADFHVNGNPDIIGAIVCKTYYGNGNTSLHYDRALNDIGEAVDYRISSYVEDTR